MPNYAAHRQITIFVGMIASPIIFYTPEIADGVLFHIGLYSTLWFSPDLDIHQRLGWAGKLLGLEAYRSLIPHRYGLRREHWEVQKSEGNRKWYQLKDSHIPIWKVFLFSHIPLVGTLPRTILLFAPLIIVLLLTSSIEEFKVRWFLWALMGMTYSDIFHILADIITSDFKRMTKGYWLERSRVERKGRASYKRSSGDPERKSRRC